MNTYQFEELLATKLRALYQRKKGRDLFDLWLALKHNDLDINKLVEIFLHYMNRENKVISREVFENNLNSKLQEQVFVDDINQLLSPELLKIQSNSRVIDKNNYRVTNDGKKRVTDGWSLFDAAEEIKQTILALLPKTR